MLNLTIIVVMTRVMITIIIKQLIGLTLGIDHGFLMINNHNKIMDASDLKFKKFKVESTVP